MQPTPSKCLLGDDSNGAVNASETEEYLRNGCENKDYQDKFIKVLTLVFTFNFN